MNPINSQVRVTDGVEKYRAAMDTSTRCLCWKYPRCGSILIQYSTWILSRLVPRGVCHEPITKQIKPVCPMKIVPLGWKAVWMAFPISCYRTVDDQALEAEHTVEPVQFSRPTPNTRLSPRREEKAVATHEQGIFPATPDADWIYLIHK